MNTRQGLRSALRESSLIPHPSSLGWTIVAACLAMSSALAMAQAYPSRPIRMIVPQAPGSASDTVARLIAAELTSQMKQQVVVDNRPGGALQLGLDLTARSTPDGYTIGYCMIGAMAISPNMLRKPPVNIQKDLVPISQTTTGQMLLAASPSTPFKSVKDVIGYAKQNPGKLNNASSGNGTPGHVGFELFKFMTGTQIVHVPYKGSPDGIRELISGQVQLMFDNLTSISPHVKAGRVRGIGVSGPRRSPVFPDMPTISEAGVPGYETNAWGGVVVPAGTPRAIVMRLNAEVNAALRSATLRERYAAIDAEPVGGTPEQWAAYVRQESAKWADVVRKSGAKAD